MNQFFKFDKNEKGKKHIVELIFDKPIQKEVKGYQDKIKTVYLWGAKVDGVEKTIEASESLYRKLMDFRRGDQLEVELKHEGGYEVCIQTRAPQKPTPPPAPSGDPGPQEPNGLYDHLLGEPGPASFAVPEDVERDRKAEYWDKERKYKNLISAASVAAELYKALPPTNSAAWTEENTANFSKIADAVLAWMNK